MYFRNELPKEIGKYWAIFKTYNRSSNMDSKDTFEPFIVQIYKDSDGKLNAEANDFHIESDSFLYGDKIRPVTIDNYITVTSTNDFYFIYEFES